MAVALHPAFQGALTGFGNRYPQHLEAVEREVEFASANHADLPSYWSEEEGDEIVVLKMIRLVLPGLNEPVRIYLACDGEDVEFFNLTWGPPNRVM